LKLGNPMLPSFGVPEGMDEPTYFRKVAADGLEARFLEFEAIGKHVDKDAYRRRTLHPATNGEAVELSAQFGEVVPARGVNSGPSRGSGKTRGRPAMVGVIRRLAIAGAAAFVPVAFVTVVCPA